MSDSLWTHGHQSSVSFTISWSLLILMSIESVVQSNHLILCFPLSFCIQSFSESVFSNELALCILWLKYWSFSFITVLQMNIQCWFPYDWLVWFLCFQGNLKSLLQNHSLKVSVLQGSAFFMVQLSHLYMMPPKTVALTIRTFVSKVMSLHLICCLGLS